jgi:predicted Zn-dependent peptidase
MTEIILPLEQSELSFTASGGSSVRRSVLPSGVRILSEQVPGSQSVSVSFSVAVGSRDETNNHFGSTHFLEHLLFKGTKSRTAMDIAVAFDSVGGSSNASTGKEHTSYYAKVQDKALPIAVEVIADMLTSSLIDETEFENERPVILEELAMNDDDPHDVVHEAFSEAVLGDHPLGRPIGGTIETITNVSRAAVWEHYQHNYRPQDLVVAAAGSVDHQELIKLVEKGLSAAGWDLGLEAKPVPRRLLKPASISRGSKLNVIHRPISQVNILVGSEGLYVDDPRRYAMGVLNTVLGGGMSSRLFQEIREKRGLAYSVYAYAQQFAGSGQIGFYAGCNPTKAIEVIEIIREVLTGVAEHGMTHEEIERAKGAVRGSLVLSQEDSGSRMSRIGKNEIVYGQVMGFDEILKEIAGVSHEDVRKVASEFLTKTPTLALVGPFKSESTFEKVLAKGSYR